MKLTPQESSVLNNIFYRLIDNRTGVNGSWGAKRRFYEPTYIHRKNLILEGEKCFTDLYLLIPTDKDIPVVVTPIYEDKSINQLIFPTITKGKYVRVYTNDGVWWDTLRQEIPLMLSELVESEHKVHAE